jgi:hypothetical protein
VSNIALGGLQSAARQLETHAQRIAAPPAPPGADPGQDIVQLSAEILGLLAARNGFEVNLAVIETADEVDRAVLNLLG